MFSGFSSRLERDLNLIFRKARGGTKSRSVKISISDPAFRKHLVYIGGVALGKMIQGEDTYWITREQYNLHGPSIARRS
jgi:actin-related protein